MIIKMLVMILVSSFSLTVFAIETQKVTENVYALVGETGPRTAENFGSNNTVGFVVTKKGVVLVGSGAMPAGAKILDKAIKKITNKPIRWVINIGSQDHHWMGNSYFVERGAEVLALSRTVATQKTFIDEHLSRLKPTSGDLIKTIKPTTATRLFADTRTRFNLGGTDFEIFWPGNGHFVGDGVLWLPQQSTLFTGDFVYLDRLLGIHPFTRVKEWRHSVHKLAEYKADYVIPGHGRASTWDKVKAQTVDYLDFLVIGVSEAIDDWQDIGETTDKMADAPAFKSLKNFEDWHRRNINQTYLQLEAE